MPNFNNRRELYSAPSLKILNRRFMRCGDKKKYYTRCIKRNKLKLNAAKGAFLFLFVSLEVT